jgi:hypothetical protein
MYSIFKKITNFFSWSIFSSSNSNEGTGKIKNLIDNKEVFQEPKKLDMASIYYNKLKKLNLEDDGKYIVGEIKYGPYYYHPECILEQCLDKAIVDGNLLLVQKLHDYERSTKTYNNHEKEIYVYALLAVENEQIDIFKYFFKFYREKAQLSFVPRFSKDEEHKLMDYLVENNKVDYFRFLEKINLFNFQDYLAGYLERHTYNSKNEQRLNFILNNFPNAKLDFDKLILASCQNVIPSKEIVKTLLKFNEDIKFNCVLALSHVAKTGNLDIVKLLVENRNYEIPHLNIIAGSYAKYKHCFEVVKYLVEQGASLNQEIYDIDGETLKWLHKWNESKKLSSELKNELSINLMTLKINKKSKL